MPASTTPIFVASPQTYTAFISAANANRDGSGTIVDILTAGTNGSRIEHVDIVARSTTGNGMVRLFIYNTAAYFLFREYIVTSNTPSASARTYTTTENFSIGANLLVLPPNYRLAASTHAADPFNVYATGGDY